MTTAATKTCTAREAPSSDACGSEVVITVLLGCVHEHLVEAPSCQWHVEGLAGDAGRCLACWGVDGHVCEMSLLREVTS